MSALAKSWGTTARLLVRNEAGEEWGESFIPFPGSTATTTALALASV